MKWGLQFFVSCQRKAIVPTTVGSREILKSFKRGVFLRCQRCTMGMDVLEFFVVLLEYNIPRRGV